MKDMVVARKKMSDLQPADYNPRSINPAAMAGLKASIAQFGFVEPIIWNKRTGRIVGGHQRFQALSDDGAVETDVVVVDLGESDEIALNIALNNPAIQGEWDDSAKKLLQEVGDGLPDLFKEVRLDDLLSSLGGPKEEKAPDSSGDGDGEKEDEEPEKKPEENSLVEKFIVPPFTVLDQRKAYWRLHRADWLRFGVRGSSDPVLLSLMFKWFCPVGGKTVDVYGDDPVGGLVAGLAGCDYVGVTKQFKRNQKSWSDVQSRKHLDDNNQDVTPVEKVGEFWVKRDDLFCIGGVRGGKVRTCWSIAEGATGLVTAGSRASPQVNIVAHVAQKMGIPCRVHTPEGELSPEVEAAKACGATVVQHKGGYNSVIISRSQEDAKDRSWVEVPFGMERPEAVEQTRKQVQNVPKDTKRIVMVVGSGMSLSGVLHGLKDHGLTIPVVGISVGADPEERLNAYAPKDWQKMVTIIKSPIDYHNEADGNILGDIILDPHYEGKCLPYLLSGDLLWIVGIRQSAVQPKSKPPVSFGTTAGVEMTEEVEETEGEDSKKVKKKKNKFTTKELVKASDPVWQAALPEEADYLIFQVPAEADLEELSGRIAAAVPTLKDGRFASVVFDDEADENGFSRGLMFWLIREFKKHDMRLYNESVVIKDEPWIASRCEGFAQTRKSVRFHRNFLSFLKGEPKSIKKDFGSVDLSGLEQTLVSDPTETSEFVELE